MQNGFAIIHANHLETLLAVLQQRCAAEPLAPLEEEIILVQSNGMADWLKLKLADATGISMGLRFPMPASFLWELYRQVLAPEALAQASPFAKDSLQWRLLRLLPGLLDHPGFERPARFLAADNSRTKHFQLARKLADLFDQYQVYRADWLLDWENGGLCGLGQDEAWQAALWRALLADMPTTDRHRSRAHLHRAFMEAVKKEQVPGLPRRILLFGINSMPAQLLEALYALAPHCQLLLLVLNPCEGYWADSPDRDAPTHPLLDAWGGLGRDFQWLLSDHEPKDPALKLHSVEVSGFVDPADFPHLKPLPLALLSSLLEDRPAPTPEHRQPLPADPGIDFHPAWSRQREVEVLHDRLLDLFANDNSLRYTDVVVMMPRVEDYSAHIEAVFNRYPVDDPRHLAFAVSDRHSTDDNALQAALEWLLGLPARRITRSEVLSLLQLPALRAAFGLTEDDTDRVRTWVDLTHTRWGLGAAHRATFDLPSTSHNSWQAGLDQLLAGYCAGAADIWQGVAVDEVGANQGEVLGKLHRLLTSLADFRGRLVANHAPAEWDPVFRQLLVTFFQPVTDRERDTLALLERALADWQRDCTTATFAEPVPVSIARQGWLDKVRQQGLSQRLSFNGITFCTLMPMRALPFRHIFLLGMNDGDYPRERVTPDFDLMQSAIGPKGGRRPGDRSRRDDDQYLLLEALLSVREALHISWVGKSIRKGSDEPASVLVEQLRDYIDACWIGPDGRPASDCLTRHWPLAPFSRSYFLADAQVHTHAREWRHLFEKKNGGIHATPPSPEDTAIGFGDLVQLLKQPVSVFFNRRLKVRFAPPGEETADDEPFSLDSLGQWKLRDRLLNVEAEDEDGVANRLAVSGELPAGDFAQPLIQRAREQATSIRERLAESIDGAAPAEPVPLELTLEVDGHACTLATRIDRLYMKDGRLLRANATASGLVKDKHKDPGRLAADWVTHLLACATGMPLQTTLVGLDARVSFAPLGQDRARYTLTDLCRLCRAAMEAPLPVTAHAAMAWLAASSEDAARKAFGDRDASDLHVARIFGDFGDLNAHGRFTELAGALYGPLVEALGDNVAERMEENA